MKNLRKFCQLAIAIREVPTCIPTSSVATISKTHLCLVGVGHYKDILTFSEAVHLKYGLLTAEDNLFDLPWDEWNKLLYNPTDRYRVTSYDMVTGKDYWKAIVTLLKKHHCLQFLTRELHIQGILFDSSYHTGMYP